MAAVAPEVSEETEAAATPQSAEPRNTHRRWYRGTVVSGVLGVVAAVLLGFGVLQFLEVRSGYQADDRRAEAVRVANQVVTTLTSVSQDTAKQDIERLLRDATGPFRDQFARQAELFRSVVTTSRVSSAGQVVEAGVSSMDDETAVVLVAATATVKNKEAPKGQRRVYRMQVTLQRDGDRWLAANLELVP